MVSFKYPKTAFIEKNLQTLMPFLIPIAAKISIALTLVIALFSSGLYVGNRLGISSCQEAVIDSQRHSLEVSAKQSQISDSVTTKYVDRIKIVRGRTQEIIKEVKVYVKDDANTYLSGSFRMLHDLTIKSDPSNSTGTVDEAPVATQDVAETLVRNYGICHENSTTLSSLQEWVREQSLVR
jgi:Ethanolamine utilization protein EutJ (predicted chaperonin)